MSDALMLARHFNIRTDSAESILQSGFHVEINYCEDPWPINERLYRHEARAFRIMVERNVTRMTHTVHVTEVDVTNEVISLVRAMEAKQ